MKQDDLKKLIDEFRYMQEKDLDIFVMISGQKGLGKSNTALAIGLKYFRNYGLRCQVCNNIWMTTAISLNDKELNELKAEIKETKDLQEREELIQKYMELKELKKLEPCPYCRLKELHLKSDSESIGDSLLKLTRMERITFNPEIHKVERVTYRDYKHHIKNSIAYDNEDIKNKIYNLPPYSVVHADEGLRFLMASDWAKTENKELKKLVAQCRTKHLIFLICIPTFGWVDKKYRNDMCNYWIRLMTRGSALVCIPIISEQDDPWGLKSFSETLGQYTFLTSRNEIEVKINKLLKHPNVRDRINIPKVSEKAYSYYLLYRDAIALQKYKEEEEKEKDNANREDIIIYNVRNNFKGFIEWGKRSPTYKEIVEVLYKDPVTGQPVITENNLTVRVSNFKKIIDKKPQPKKDE